MASLLTRDRSSPRMMRVARAVYVMAAWLLSYEIGEDIWREGGREGGRERGKGGGREGGKERGREGRMEEEREERGKEGGERGREGGGKGDGSVCRLHGDSRVNCTFSESNGTPRKVPPLNPQYVSLPPVVLGNICCAYIHSIICSRSYDRMESREFKMSSPHTPKNKIVILRNGGGGRRNKTAPS